MAGLCGWAGRSDHFEKEDSKSALSVMAATLSAADNSQATLWLTDKAGLAAAEITRTVTFDADAGDCAWIHGNPRWNSSELAKIALKEGHQNALIHGFKQLGTGVLQHLYGQFTLALIIDHGNEALLATDRLGAHPLCYRHSDEGLEFASRTDTLAFTPFSKEAASLNEQAIYDYVYFHMVPIPDAMQQGITRLSPGQFVHLKNEQIETDVYSRTHYNNNKGRNFEALKSEFRSILTESVGEYLKDDRKVGAFLSGGTDSSTIVGTMRAIKGEATPCYSIGFDAPGFDETEYARIAAKHFDVAHQEYYITPADIVEAIPKIAQFYDSPFGNSSAVPTYFCAQLAKRDGMDLILGGDGGDELFGGNERYASQQVFDTWSHIPSPLRKGLIEPLLKLFPFGEKVWPIRKGRRYVEQANVPMPDRIQSYNILNMIGAEKVFTPEFLARINSQQPLILQREVYHQADSNSDLNRHLALDMKFTLADNDLPKVGGGCEMAGMDVAYPLLDDRLVEFSAGLPDDFKTKKFKLRWFYKEALKDFLPHEIIHKTKHGFGLPFGLWIEQHAPLKEMVESSLSDLKKRNIITARFIDELQGDLMQEHASYYGVSIWILVMLEQWMQAHDMG